MKMQTISWSKAGHPDARLLAASLLLALVGCGGGADSDGVPRGHAGAAQNAPKATIAAPIVTPIARAEVDRDAQGRDMAVRKPSSTVPEVPTLQLVVDGRQLRFSWTAARTATHYKLFANPDGTSGFTQAGSALAADITGAALGIGARHDWARARYLIEACNDAGCTASNSVTTFTARPLATAAAHATNARVGQPKTASASADAVASRVCIRCPNPQ
jgi:hypothetical protein